MTEKQWLPVWYGFFGVALIGGSALLVTLSFWW